LSDPVTGESKIDEYWLRFQSEVRDAAEIFEKRAIEYHKAGVEFSKILVTNLFVLNAGGLIALPALSTFLGVAALPGPTRSWVLWLSAAGFGAGLLMAALCALVTYLNYHAFVDCAVAERDLAMFNVATAFGKNGPIQAEIQRAKEPYIADVQQLTNKINLTFRLGHVFGWLSILSFIGAGVWLGTQLR
jgi:hypothetical protein